MEREFEDQPVLMGVCAALARRADLDPMIVRGTALVIGAYLAPILIPAYIVAGFLLNSQRCR